MRLTSLLNSLLVWTQWALQTTGKVIRSFQWVLDMLDWDGYWSLVIVVINPNWLGVEMPVPLHDSSWKLTSKHLWIPLLLLITCPRRPCVPTPSEFSCTLLYLNVFSTCTGSGLSARSVCANKPHKTAQLTSQHPEKQCDNKCQSGRTIKPHLGINITE